MLIFKQNDRHFKDSQGALGKIHVQQLLHCSSLSNVSFFFVVGAHTALLIHVFTSQINGWQGVDLVHETKNYKRFLKGPHIAVNYHYTDSCNLDVDTTIDRELCGLSNVKCSWNKIF